MPSLVDELRAVLSRSSRVSPQSLLSSRGASLASGADSLAKKPYEAMANPASLSKSFLTSFEFFLSNPSVDGVSSLRKFLDDVRGKYGNTTYLAVLNDVRNALSGSPYAVVLDDLLNGVDPQSIVNRALKIRKSILLSKLSTSLGMSAEALNSLSPEQLSELLKGKIKSLLGSGDIKAGKVKDVIKQVGDLWRYGVTVFRKDMKSVLDDLLTAFSGGRPSKETTKSLVDFLRHAYVGNVEGAVKALSDLKASATHSGGVKAGNLRKVAEESVKKEGEAMSKEAGIMAERLKNLTSSVRR